LAPARDALLGLVANRALRIDYRLDENMPEVRALCKKYGDTPMSVADACVVRMAEIQDKHAVFTLDSDFIVYRKNGQDPLELILPG